MHNTECAAYEIIREMNDFPAPEIYYLEIRTPESQGMIMMEDLSRNGISFGILLSVTQEHCFNLARHIADFQAYVNFLPDKPWEGKFSNNIHANIHFQLIWNEMLRPFITDSNEDIGMWN